MGGFTLTSAAAVSARRLFNPRQSSIARRQVVATPARAFLGKVKEMVRSVSSTAATGTGDTYTVTFCSNWDGGQQEFEAAKAAVLQVHPDANVVGNRIDEYPITVTVTLGSPQDGETLWSGRQQGLFSRNGRSAQKDIIAALEEARVEAE